jgi:diguanylate cyclase (GGDEF)-like protein
MVGKRIADGGRVTEAGSGIGSGIPGREAGGEGTDLDSILAFMAGELGADAALLSIQDRRLGDARICSAWGQWRPLRGELYAGMPDGGVQAGDDPIADALVVPVRSPSGRHGALAVGFVGRLGDNRALALDALVSYAALFGLWLDDAGALQRLVRAAYRDALTGCLSYAALMHEVEREVRRAERTGRPLACLFVDVDEFKAVNDAGGHQTANRVLIEWASKLMGRVRQTDVVGRYGGDEFVLVLPDTDAEGAEALAEGLRAETVHATGTLLGEEVSASIGVSEWSSEISVGELIDAADAAMQAGRGRDVLVR